jgi:hypothetical protein
VVCKCHFPIITLSILYHWLRLPNYQWDPPRQEKRPASVTFKPRHAAARMLARIGAADKAFRVKPVCSSVKSRKGDLSPNLRTGGIIKVHVEGTGFWARFSHALCARNNVLVPWTRFVAVNADEDVAYTSGSGAFLDDL